MATPTGQTYGELQTAFDHYNWELFDGRLPPCLITLQRKAQTFGYFCKHRFVHAADRSMTDEIALNPEYFARAPLVEILQTLVHEMTHAWQAHFGDPGRRSYHNKEWARKMESIGLMPSSTGRPGGAKTGERVSDYPIEGGPFMQATEALLTREFRISWVDRFARAVDVTAGHVLAPELDLDGASAITAPVMGEADPALIAPSPARNRSNRVKYRCPGCGAQAWGKPNLRLLCGEEDCNGVPFNPV